MVLCSSARLPVVVAHDKAGGQSLDSPRRRESGGPSLRQTRHPLKLQYQPQDNHSIIDVVAASRMVQTIGDVPPSITFAEFGRQAALHKLANIAERVQCRDGRDF
jgi:hypothetical protein